MRTRLSIVIILLFSAKLLAQDELPDTLRLSEVVVTGTKYPLPVEKSGKTIYKLTKKDIDQNAGKSVADLLNEVPGIQMDGNFGTPGTNFSYFVRGAGSQQTLVLIDGMPLNDPSGTSLAYDFRQLPVNQIESIEVLKGGLSTLYGTGAAAAVINITLKDPSDQELSGTVDVSGGSFGTFSQNFDVGGSKNGLTYFYSGNNLNSEGFSAALDEDPATDFDDDGFSQQNALMKLGYKVNDRLNIGVISGYDRFEADFDGGEFFDDPGNFNDTRQIRVGINSSYKYSRGQFNLNSVYNTNEREIEGSFPSVSSGRNLQLDLNNKHNFTSSWSGLFGINVQQFSFEVEEQVDFDDTQFTMVDPYASLFYDSPSGLTIHAGVRMNNHNEYGTHLVYNLNPSYLAKLAKKVRVKSFVSVSSAFVSPSLFQLYSPSFGNSELDPEESVNYEAGVSFYLGEKLTFNAVYFLRDEENAIAFVGNTYENVANERQVDGFELDLDWQAHEKINVKLNYAHADSDIDNDAGFYRIPNDKFGVWLNVAPVKALDVSLKYNYTGERTVFVFSDDAERTLDSFQVVDLFASYGLFNEKVSVYGAVNNIFNEDFIAIAGFTTRDRNYSVGVRYNF